MDTDKIIEKIKDDIAAKFPEWNVSIHSPFRDQVKTPAMLIECEAGNPPEKIEDGDTRIWVELDLSVKVAMGNMDQAATAMQSANVCTALSQFIAGQTWGLEDTKPADWRGFVSEPFIKELDHVAYWSVNWSQEFLLGQPNPIAVDEVEELHLGLSPGIGPDHVAKYIEIVDE